MYLLDGVQRIVKVHGHYEIHTMDGKFICSGDTWEECYNDLKEMLKTEAQMIQPVSA